LKIIPTWSMVGWVGSLWYLVVVACQNGAFIKLGQFVFVKPREIVLNEFPSNITTILYISPYWHNVITRWKKLVNKILSIVNVLAKNNGI
jgi:hypothetical protein